MRRVASAGFSDGRFSDFLRARLDELRSEIELEVVRLARERVSAQKDGDGLRSYIASSEAEHHKALAHKDGEGLRSHVTSEAEHNRSFGDFTPLSSPGARSNRHVILGDCGSEHSDDASVHLVPSSQKCKHFGALRSFRSSLSSMELLLAEEQQEGDGGAARRARRQGKTVYAGSIGNGDHQNALKGVLNSGTTLKKRPSEAFSCSMASYVNKWGEWFITAITIANAITIGVSVDNSPTALGWTIAEAVFAFAYLFHMFVLMSFLGVREYFVGAGGTPGLNFLKDSDLRWRWFEVVIVVAQLSEVAISLMNFDQVPPTGTFRLLRLTRVARLLRFAKLKIFSELSMMIHGAIGGMRTLLWGFVMISLPLYAVALFVQQALNANSSSNRGPGSELFETLPMAAFTVFRCSVAGDCSTDEGKPVFLLISQHYGLGYAALYCAMNVFMMCGIFNVIAAIFVENMLDAAKKNSISEKRARLLDAQMFAEKITELVQYIADKHKAARASDKRPSAYSGGGDPTIDMIGEIDLHLVMQIRITPRFMSELSKERRFRNILRDLDIAEEDLIDLFDTLDVDGSGAIDLEELVIGLRKLRGSARKSDIVEVALIVRSSQLQMQEFMEQMSTSFAEMQSSLKGKVLHSAASELGDHMEVIAV